MNTQQKETTLSELLQQITTLAKQRGKEIIIDHEKFQLYFNYYEKRKIYWNDDWSAVSLFITKNMLEKDMKGVTDHKIQKLLGRYALIPCYPEEALLQIRNALELQELFIPGDALYYKVHENRHTGIPDFWIVALVTQSKTIHIFPVYFGSKLWKIGTRLIIGKRNKSNP